MESIKQILIRRDSMTAKEAEELIDDARRDLHSRLSEGEMPSDICAEWFGLEEDYVMELF
jgi:hypothetical protein